VKNRIILGWTTLVAGAVLAIPTATHVIGLWVMLGAVIWMFWPLAFIIVLAAGVAVFAGFLAVFVTFIQALVAGTVTGLEHKTRSGSQRQAALRQRARDKAERK